MEDKRIVIEFKAAWNSKDRRYCRIGLPDIQFETDIYRKITDKDLTGLTQEEKMDLVDRANILTTFLNSKAKRFVYDKSFIGTVM